MRKGTKSNWELNLRRPVVAQSLIRRRRPTPATLFRVADQASPEDDQSTHQWVVGENGVLKPKRVNPNVYQPPSLRAVQKMAEAHMQHLGVYPPLEDFEGEEYHDYHWHEEEGEEEEGEEEEKSPSQGADQKDTPTAEITEKVSNVTMMSKQVQEDDDEEEDEKEEMKEEGKTGKQTGE
ncbi:protein phosphatase 1 regulatory subunit 1B [Hypomesus transpacificus]|uniref:protein phosphatase 1 regulatory subunit 1B n=1 Tax=Hypomesus transpacificus TaxID=137520 RepID=UPI001F0886D7|nr:protein phosphatase 1 regulatory subunit 1B [Hypomesus transpacificus]